MLFGLQLVTTLIQLAGAERPIMSVLDSRHGMHTACSSGTALTSGELQCHGQYPKRKVSTPMALLRGRHTQSSSCSRRQPAGAKRAGPTDHNSCARCHPIDGQSTDTSQRPCTHV